MTRLLILLSVLMLAAMACSLTSGDAPAARPATRTPFASAPVITNPPVTTNTPAPQPTATTRPASSGNPAPVANCTPRTDWPVYTVQAGDTVGTIAQRTGTTAAQLATANCLSNPNLIAVGQQMRVPRQPSPVVVPTTSTNPGPVVIGSQAGSGVQTDGYNYWVPTGTTIVIAWPDAARLGATQVEFLFKPDAATAPQSLGIDYDLAYDASVAWVVPSTARGQVYAVGRGSRTVESARVRLEAVPGQTPAPGPVLVGSPAGSGVQTDGFNYWVPANTNVYLSWPDAARLNAGPVEFFYEPDGGSPQSLGTDYDIATDAGVYWTVTLNIRGAVYAVGRGNPVQSARIRVEGVPSQSPEPGPVVIGSPAGSGVQTDGFNYWVPAGTEVYLSWPEAARLAPGAGVFIFVPDGGSPQSLGRDDDIATDAGIYYTVPLNMRGTIYAMGTGINPVQSANIRIEGVPAS